MKTKVLVLSLVLFFTFFPKQSFSHSFIGSPVSSVINELKTGLKDVIYTADYAVSKNAFDFKQYIMLISNNLDRILEENINLVFDRLDESQKKFLTDLDAVLKDLEKNMAKDLGEIVDKLAVVAGALPFGKRSPTVTSIAPSFYNTNMVNNQSPLEIRGSYLAKGKPYIEINNSKYYPQTKIDTRLEFVLPDLNQYFDSTRTKMVTYKLIVYKKGFLKKKPVVYDIGFSLVPERLGNYQLYVKEKYYDTIRMNRRQEFNHKNEHCQGAQSLNWPFNAQNGYKIDIKSIRTDSVVVSTKSSFHGISNISENGFRCDAKVVNNGECVRIFGKRYARDGRGQVRGIAKWTEYKIDEKYTEFNLLAENSIFWGKDILINLPKNTTHLRLVIRQIDGQVKEITSEANEDWYKIIHNEKGPFLSIRPKQMDIALR